MGSTFEGLFVEGLDLTGYKVYQLEGLVQGI
jgi:hypothetical protein